MRKVIPTDSNLIPDEAECVFEGDIFQVFQWQQKLYDGSSKIFEKLKRPDTVSVFAIVDKKIVVLEDEQPHRLPVIALPGGRVDPGELSTLDAAKREVEEETGYSFKQWKLIEVRQPEEKIEWFIYTYIAYGGYTKGEAHIDAGERIKVMLKSYGQVKALADAGERRFKDQTKLAVAKSLEDFIDTPEFIGQEVDR